MSLSEYTPGPWQLDGGYLSDADGQTIVHNIEPSWVPGAWANDPLATANAHLIAAAPELYEALLYIVTSNDLTTKAAKAAHSALAKAVAQ